MKICHACKGELAAGRKVGRQDACPLCRADLHCCLNCTFHEESVYNQCRETQAERVVNKNRMNFCDYFVFRDASPSGKGPQASREQMEALFKKQ